MSTRVPAFGAQRRGDRYSAFMEYPDINPLVPTLVGTGIVGLLVTIGFAVLAFVASAFITALWVRLIITFMRKTLDREYGRMRMASLGYAPGRARAEPEAPIVPLRNEDGPRDWQAR